MFRYAPKHPGRRLVFHVSPVIDHAKHRMSQYSQPPAATRTGPILFTLCLAVLCVQVDTSVTNLAVRPVAEAFDAGVSTMQWLVDGYNLSYALLLLTGGLLADLFGRRRVFMAGALLFSAASLLCALAPTLPVLLVGRVLAGVGAALLLPSSLAMIRVVWRDEGARGRALGVWAGCNGLALCIGPVVGGLLVHSFGWRSMFFLTVPLAAVALPLAARWMPESADRQGRHFDLAGQVLGVVALAAFTLAAIEIHREPLIALLAVPVFLVAVAAFVRVEKRLGEAALVPLALFQVAAFRGSVVATLGMTFGMYATLFLLPMTWIASGRLDVFSAGLALLPMALVFVVVSPFSGALLSRFAFRATVVTGLGTIVVGVAVVAIGAGVALPVAAIGLALTGVGMGLATGPLMGGAVNAVNSARSGTAAALINVARMVGATLGVALMGSLYALVGGGYHGLMLALLTAAALQAVALLVATGDLSKPMRAGVGAAAPKQP